MGEGVRSNDIVKSLGIKPRTKRKQIGENAIVDHALERLHIGQRCCQNEGVTRSLANHEPAISLACRLGKRRYAIGAAPIGTPYIAPGRQGNHLTGHGVGEIHD